MQTYTSSNCINLQSCNFLKLHWTQVSELRHQMKTEEMIAMIKQVIVHNRCPWIYQIQYYLFRTIKVSSLIVESWPCTKHTTKSIRGDSSRDRLRSPIVGGDTKPLSSGHVFTIPNGSPAELPGTYSFRRFTQIPNDKVSLWDSSSQVSNTSGVS